MYAQVHTTICGQKHSYSHWKVGGTLQSRRQLVKSWSGSSKPSKSCSHITAIPSTGHSSDPYILGKVSMLLGEDDSSDAPAIRSEAELRFARADPTVEMLCNLWGYQVTT